MPLGNTLEAGMSLSKLLHGAQYDRVCGIALGWREKSMRRRSGVAVLPLLIAI
jgi:hypothetical protein